MVKLALKENFNCNSKVGGRGGGGWLGPRKEAIRLNEYSHYLSPASKLSGAL